MILSSISFALVNLCVKFLHHIPVNELIFFRSIISLSISYVIIKKANIPFFGNNRSWLIGRGIFGVTALTMFFSTIKSIPIASATTIQYLSPIFTVIFAMFLLKEKIKPYQWLLFLIAFCGVLLIKGFDNQLETKYVLLGIGSAFCSGIAYNCIMKCRETDKPITVVMYFPLIATPVMGIWCLFDWKTPEGIEWLLLLFIGFMTQIAQLTMTKALHSESSSKIMPIKYIGAIWAIIIGYTVFDERLNYVTMIGIFLVLLGVVTNTLIKSKSQ